jgi:hypothetical protein
MVGETRRSGDADLCELAYRTMAFGSTVRGELAFPPNPHALGPAC